MARRFWRRFASGRKQNKKMRRGAGKVFWGAFFSKKVRPCPYRRAAHIKKLGKQGLCPAFPGRRRSEKVASPGLGCELVAALSVTAAAVPAPPKGEPSLASPFGGRWCPVGTVQRLVSAAASVGDGRSPLGCITRAGRRECPPREGGEGTPPPGSFCLVKGKSEVFFRDFSLFAGESGCFLQNPRAVL